MTDDFDAGPIIERMPVSFADGISMAEASRILARSGAVLVKNHINRILNKEKIEIIENIGGSYQHWPTLQEFCISTEWTARHAFNFIKATSHWKQEYKVNNSNYEISILDVISYNHEYQSEFIKMDSNIASIKMQDGVLVAIVT
jgi:methionyl-tRNA formyltransferase